MQPILKIDLTNRAVEPFIPPDEWKQDYIGGASLAARILYDYLTPDLNPLSPEASLLFLNGPLSGTAGPAVGRFIISALSPGTGLWGESNCGGFWGPELRKAGFDGLWLTGRTEHPTYLQILDGDVEFHDATHLWGLETYQTQEAIEQEIGPDKFRIATIGPAGERGIPFALILTDHGRVAGRTGMGAVMGSKNLKAVAVRGTGEVPVWDPQTFKKLRSQSNRELRDDNVSRVGREAGTASVADYFEYLGEMPGRYFKSGSFGSVDNVSGSTMADTILSGVSACHACVIACKKRKGPEYETIVGFGPNLWIDDLARITRLGELCDRYGMDSISMSNTIGMAFTLFEEGIITEKDTFGLTLTWGDGDAVAKLVSMTAKREGFGDILARGALELGRYFGVEDRAVQVNGLEVAYHDPRGSSGMGLVYATSPRGACHNQSDYYLTDLVGYVESSLGMEYFDRHAGAEKAGNVSIHQDWRTVFNSLVLCFFANVEPQMVVDLTNAATERDYTLQAILRVGERSWNLKRVINHRLGLSRQDDNLPNSLQEPYPEGGSAGYQLPFEEMLMAYYKARDWDASTGHPSRKKLKRLGLDWVSFTP